MAAGTALRGGSHRAHAIGKIARELDSGAVPGRGPAVLAGFSRRLYRGPGRDPVPAGARRAAGLHRRAVRRRPRRDARRDAAPRRRSEEDQPAGAVRPRHRPLGAGRRVRQQDAPSRRTSKLEFQRNRERYEFLKWGQQSLTNFRVVPPGMGIVHQVNLEYLARACSRRRTARARRVPRHLVGTDSHTTMINGLGVLGWGVGGIEAEAVMLGQPTYMLLPEVVGMELTGKLPEGATATDLVLTVTQMLRKHGVVEQVRRVLRQRRSARCRSPTARRSPTWRPSTARRWASSPSTPRPAASSPHRPQQPEQVALVEAYCKAQGLFWTADAPEPEFTRRCRSTSRRSCRASPARSARRTASARAMKSELASGLAKRREGPRLRPAEDQLGQGHRAIEDGRQRNRSATAPS
jgi:hypothetical protein